MPSWVRVPLLALLLAPALPAVAADAVPETKTIDEAKIHYKAGESYYQHGDYGAAKREFDESYRLSNKGALLYNIALCEEKLGELKEAAASLRSYLLVPESARDRAIVNDKLKHLDEQVSKREATTAGKPVETVAPAPTPEKPPSPAVSGYRKYAWPMLGVGAVSLLGSLVTGLLAHNHFSNLEMRCGAQGDACPPDFAGERDLGQSLSYASDGLLFAGVAAVAVSVVLFVAKRPARKDGAELTLLPSLSLDRAGLAAVVTF